MVKTYEELLAAQTELAHFNPNHDPKTGKFAKTNNAPSVDYKTTNNKTDHKKKIIKTLDAARDTIILVKSIIGIAIGVAFTATVVKAMSPILKEILGQSINNINRNHRQVEQTREKVERILGSGLGNMTLDDLSKLDLY